MAGGLVELDLLDLGESVEHLAGADLALRLEPGGRAGERLLQAPHLAPERAGGEIEVVLVGGGRKGGEGYEDCQVAEGHGRPVCLCAVVICNDHFYRD